MNADWTSRPYQQLQSTKKEDKGHDGLWQSTKSNGLSKIKGAAYLAMTTANVAKAWKKAWKSCLSRWKVFLYERRYSKFVIDEYLKFGLLPRLIQRTYNYYYGLLTTARDLGHNAQGPVPWKGSRAESVIRFHADTLGLQRSLAPDYCAHLLEAYVHLRDADKAE